MYIFWIFIDVVSVLCGICDVSFIKLIAYLLLIDSMMIIKQTNRTGKKEKTTNKYLIEGFSVLSNVIAISTFDPTRPTLSITYVFVL